MYNISVSVVNEADVLVIVPGYKQIAYTTLPIIIVFRFRFLYNIIYIYLSQNGGARVSLNLPSFYSLCLHLRSPFIE